VNGVTVCASRQDFCSTRHAQGHSCVTKQAASGSCSVLPRYALLLVPLLTSSRRRPEVPKMLGKTGRRRLRSRLRTHMGIRMSFFGQPSSVIGCNLFQQLPAAADGAGLDTRCCLEQRFWLSGELIAFPGDGCYPCQLLLRLHLLHRQCTCYGYFQIVAPPAPIPPSSAIELWRIAQGKPLK
jgi:hypothetical protein